MISADQKLYRELKPEKAKRLVVEIAISRPALLATAIVLSLSLPISVFRFCFPLFFYLSSRFLRGRSHSRENARLGVGDDVRARSEGVAP